MNKRYSFLMFGLMWLQIFLFTGWAAADYSNDIWVVKAKSTGDSVSVFHITMGGLIIRGEPNDSISSETISLKGDQYLSAPNWFKNGDAMYTPWGNKPITYRVDSAGGDYKIGLSVKNFASSDPSWTKPTGYNQFKVDVYVDNKRQGTLKIEASDTEVKTAYLDKALNIKSGKQDVKFVWVNDSYNPRAKQDANIEIHDVLFENTN